MTIPLEQNAALIKAVALGSQSLCDADTGNSFSAAIILSHMWLHIINVRHNTVFFAYIKFCTLLCIYWSKGCNAPLQLCYNEV